MGIQIAIDGPSGAGKSTISKKIAGDLGYIYVDTGAMYRAIGLFICRENVCPTDGEAVITRLCNVSIDIAHINNVQHIFLNGEDVSFAIREHKISQYASDVSAIPAVREFLLDLQRKFAREHDVIMDGRDIGTVIFPEAQVKIFLTASPEVRAKRRHLELIEKGQHVTFDKVITDIVARDDNDSKRATAPLKAAKDAVVVDTSNYSFSETVELIKKIIKDRLPCSIN